ncbi:L-fucose isomerase [Mahella australiensis]|uniref:L-fucose isomerase n=1 Tax=Mahella australiensis (strain DSM 15567 / CIP 107919 / 50-1 BON) TaxID=697281 RepID=F3ZZ52_MAHA5|nr:L-fucose isomerase [Mahella australiensis]AEE97834.1 L-fucose isomerase [Mahella australiensis 50-1 BON]
MSKTDSIEHIRVGYLPLVRLTFDTVAADEACVKTADELKKAGINLVWDGKSASDTTQAAAAVKELADKAVDVIIMQSATFVDGQFALAVAQNWNGPIILWSVDEPTLTGRLRLNSLTGANLLANTLYSIRRNFKFVHGNPDDKETLSQIIGYIRVIGVLRELNGATLGVFGNQPSGYYPSAVDELGLAGLLGVNVRRYNLNGLFDEAEQVTDAQAREVIDRLSNDVEGIPIETSQTIKSAKMYLTLQKLVEQHNLLGVAVECWPGFFNDYGSAACSALSELNELGVMAACEADVNGLISMIIESRLSGENAYLGDMVRINKEQNSAVFWHCGTGARCLAAPGCKPVASVHPNRKQGLVYDFVLKPGNVTIMRLSKGLSDFRMLVMEGKALDENSSHFTGTSVEIRFDKNIEDIAETLFYNGIEHHYCIGYGNHSRQLFELAREIGIDVLKV